MIDRTNANTALASALAEELVRSGVRRAVICPGSRSTPVALALLRQQGIETTTIVDERSAAYFALGAAAASRAPVAIVCTSGTAAVNFHPAVCEADESDQPLIAITCDRPPELRGIGAGQTIDQLGIFGSSVRWFCEVGTHDADDSGLLHMRSVACRAVAVAAGDPGPGPVHLNMAWRDPLGTKPVEGAVSAESELALTGRGTAAFARLAQEQAAVGAAVIADLAEGIGASRRPLIACGRLPGPEGTHGIVQLAKALGAPILAEPTSQLRFGRHDRSHVIGAYDPIAQLRPPELEPDLVLRFGELPTSKALRQWLAEMPAAEQISIRPDWGHWHDPTRAASRLVRGASGPVATALAEALEPQKGADRDWLRGWIDAGGAVEAAHASLADTAEPGLQRLLAGAYAEGDLVYTASSLPVRDQETYAGGGETDVLFLANRGANGIDGLVSSGVGAAVASGRPAWIVTGELGLHHDSNGLALVRHATTPVRIVVVNNGGGGIFEQLPQASELDRAEFDAILGTPEPIDIAGLAAVNRLPHRPLSPTPAELADLDHSCVLELRTDRRESAALRTRLTEAAHSALTRARTSA